MKQTIEINWELMGAELVNQGDVEQIKFFTGFIKELMSWDTHVSREMQMCAIYRGLKDTDRKNLDTYLSAIYTEL